MALDLIRSALRMLDSSSWLLLPEHRHAIAVVHRAASPEQYEAERERPSERGEKKRGGNMTAENREQREEDSISV